MRKQGRRGCTHGAAHFTTLTNMCTLLPYFCVRKPVAAPGATNLLFYTARPQDQLASLAHHLYSVGCPTRRGGGATPQANSDEGCGRALCSAQAGKEEEKAKKHS
jgi:hypothetical protein